MTELQSTTLSATEYHRRRAALAARLAAAESSRAGLALKVHMGEAPAAVLKDLRDEIGDLNDEADVLEAAWGESRRKAVSDAEADRLLRRAAAAVSIDMALKEYAEKVAAIEASAMTLADSYAAARTSARRVIDLARPWTGDDNVVHFAHPLNSDAECRWIDGTLFNAGVRDLGGEGVAGIFAREGGLVERKERGLVVARRQITRHIPELSPDNDNDEES